MIDVVARAVGSTQRHAHRGVSAVGGPANSMDDDDDGIRRFDLVMDRAQSDSADTGIFDW